MLESLLEALKHSPNNVPLKLQVAILYTQQSDWALAEQHLIEILQLQADHNGAKYHLALSFYKQDKIAAAEVILEELYKNDKSIAVLELWCYCLIQNGAIADAQDIYKELLTMAPEYTNEDFDDALKQTSSQTGSDSDVDNDGLSLLNKPTINFESVGGMDQVKREIELKIIKPLEHPELYAAYGKKIGGGILMYGPPGCGKTHLARATAGQINANFINVGINEILDMWIGSSERNLHEIFELARKNTPSVIFIDEIDALGANRNDINKTAGRTVINQFLSELDGVDSNNDGVLVIGATNAPWYLDPAFRRPGRFDRILFVAPPDVEARKAIFRLSLKGKPIEILNYDNLAKSTKEFSGADIQAVIDIAIEKKLEAAFTDGVPKPLSTKDLLKAIKQVKSSTKEWFNSARNYALYSNTGGLYDDILDYLNLKK